MFKIPALRILRRGFVGASRLVLQTNVRATRSFTSAMISSSGRTAQNRLPYSAVRYFASASTDGHEIPEDVLNLTAEEYQKVADTFLERLLDELENLSDELPERIPDIELTQGVMTLEVAGLGTYVINKQPPNKQIWLSSPVSGPNRFDLYQGEWISLRDGSKLLDILNKELDDAIPEQEVHFKL